MNKFLALGLATVAAAPIALAPVATVQAEAATYTTKQICLPSQGKGFCVQAPSSWRAETTSENPVGLAYSQSTMMGSRWTPYFVELSGHTPWAEGCVDTSATAQIVQAQPTRFVDARGRRAYVVTYVEQMGDTWTAQTQLTSYPVKSGSTIRTCTAKHQPVLDGSDLTDAKGNALDARYVDSERSIPTKARALAAAKDVRHRMAYNVLATIGNGR